MTNQDLLIEIEACLTECYRELLPVYEAAEEGRGDDKALSALSYLAKAIWEAQAQLGKPHSVLAKPSFVWHGTARTPSLSHDYDMNKISSIYKKHWKIFVPLFHKVTDDLADGVIDCFDKATDEMWDACDLAECGIDGREYPIAQRMGVY